MNVDMHKAAGIIIQNRKLLVTRTKGKDVFVAPGGKLEPDETVEEALTRELQEELAINIDMQTLEKFGTYFAVAAGSTDTQLQMDVFMINNWQGEITPQSEIEELLWIDSTATVKQGSIFQHEVIPELKSKGLID